MRRLIYGVGINDADYATKPTIDGNQVNCPFYERWRSMLKRCYSEVWHKKYPAYSVCYVCEDWLTFSSFKNWMQQQDWKGKELDKDVLIQGNKTYSPDTCIFVTMEVNKLLHVRTTIRGNLPQGVFLNKPSGKYYAQVSLNATSKYIGTFDTTGQAREAYKVAKYEIIRKVALAQDEPLRSALLNYKIT